MNYTVDDLEALWPKIRWREPIGVVTGEGSGYDCRICIANFGAVGSKPPRFDTLEKAETHMREVHS